MLCVRYDGDSKTVRNGHVLVTSDHHPGYQCYFVNSLVCLLVFADIAMCTFSSCLVSLQYLCGEQ